MKLLKLILETAFPAENVEIKRNANEFQYIEVSRSNYIITKIGGSQYFVEKTYIGQLVPIGTYNRDEIPDIVKLIEIERRYDKLKK